MSDRVLASLQAQLNRLQNQVDAMEERLGPMVENINFLRGDAQRVNDPLGVPLPDGRLPSGDEGTGYADLT